MADYIKLNSTCIRSESSALSRLAFRYTHPSPPLQRRKLLKNNFYRTQVNLGSDSWVRLSVTKSLMLCRLNWCDSGWCEDTNSIPTHNAKRAIQGNVRMQWCNLVANFRINVNGAIWCPNLQLIQVAPSCGQISTNVSGAIWWPNFQLMLVVP